MTEKTAMEQAVLMLLHDYRKRKAKSQKRTLRAERLIAKITGDYPIEDATAHQTAGECAIVASEDTREKLEADVRAKVVHSPMVDKDEDALVASVRVVFGWLDRQEAITEFECREYEEELRSVHRAEMAAMTARRDQLFHNVQRLESDLRAMTAERDHWRDEVASLRKVLDALTRQLADYQDARDEGVA